MKIALISPSPAHLTDMVQVLKDASHTVMAFEGGKSRLREVAQAHHPDLVFVDGICRDISELTQVQQTTAEDPSLSVVLLCSSHTPDFLLEAMRSGVREVLPSPPTSESLLAAVERLGGKRRAGTEKADARVLAFMGCKGGSGATFLATNLGWELAETNRVLLVDLNLQFGDALAFLHDGKARSSIADLAREIRRLDAALLTSSTVKLGTNYHLLPSPEDLHEAADVRPEMVSTILGVAASHYDFILLDLPRNLDALGIAALDRAWRIYPVLQANLPDIRHASRLLTAFRSLGYADDKIEFILNRYQKNEEIGLAEFKRSIGALKVQTVPNDWHDVNSSIATGLPVMRSARGSGVARHLVELAHSLSPRPEAQRGLLDKLFRKA